VPDDQIDPSLTDSGFPAAIGVAFAVFGVFVVVVLVLIVVSAVKRYRAAKAVGLDPFAADVQVMGRVHDSALLAPERSTQERLAEVDELARTGSISAAEQDAARARILGSL
jgi:uncharacterized membrane protein YqjE